LKEEVLHTKQALLNKQVILYPTDTVWGIGCDATDNKAVEKIYQIKQREESKSLIILVDSFEMLSRFVKEIPDTAKEELSKAQRPTTIIYKNPIGLAKNCIASDNTIAIRIVQNDFCIQLIKEFDKPIVSTSANISGEPTPTSFSEISTSILDSVDYIVNLQRDKIATTSSRILRITDDHQVEVIRE
jgi:L-threonylcarbamoyladenylate synthase